MMSKLLRLIEITGVTSLVLLLFLVLLQIIFRYLMDQSYFFTEELGRYCLIWATLAACALEVYREGHIRVDFLLKKLPVAFQKVWRTVVLSLTLLLFLILSFTGFQSALFNHGQESAGMQIPLSIPFIAIPLFFSLCAIVAGHQLYCSLRTPVNK